jgi:hypothetical protein
MDSASLTQEQKEVLASKYQAPLAVLAEVVALGHRLNEGEIAYGLDLVNRYYAYLEACGIPYGRTALAVVNKRGFVGQMTDVHLERQLKFEGISNIEQMKPVLSICLAERDAKLRISQEVSSQDIAAYHFKVYEKLKLPIYAWSGLLLTKVGGEKIWEAALHDDNVFGEALKNAFGIVGNLSKDHIDGYSVARMRSSFSDAIQCSTPGLKAICSADFKLTEISLDSDPFAALAEKWGVDKSQVIKAHPEATFNKFMNKDLFFIKDNEYLILSKSEVLRSKSILADEIKKIIDTHFNKLRSHLKQLEQEVRKNETDLLTRITELNPTGLSQESAQNAAQANAKQEAAAQRAQQQVAVETAADQAAAATARRNGSNAHIVARVQAQLNQELQQIEADFNRVQAVIDAKMERVKESAEQLQEINRNRIQNKIECEKFYKNVGAFLEQALRDIDANGSFDVDAFTKSVEKELTQVIRRLKTW